MPSSIERRLLICLPVLHVMSLDRPNGSKWYFPSALRLDQTNKYFLMAPSYERAGMLGFRCVVDAATRPPSAPHFTWAPPSAFTNLSAASTLDWLHVGSFGDATPARMAHPTHGQLVSPVTAPVASSAFSNCPTAFSWNDGPPAAPIAANTTTGIYNTAGFNVSVDLSKLPAAAFPVTVSFFVGAYGGRGRFSVFAAGAGSWTNDDLAPPATMSATVRYDVLLASATTLDASWVATTSADGSNVTFEGVRVATDHSAVRVVAQ